MLRCIRVFGVSPRLACLRTWHISPVSMHLSSYLGSESSGNPLHDMGARKVCSQISHSAIDILRQFLSSESDALDSPAALRSLYYHAEARNQLGSLEPKMFTLLISLFGSLSIDSCTPVIYRVPLTSRFPRLTQRRTYWRFVLKVGRDMSERGMPFHASDHFWLMCAELARVYTSSHPERLSDVAYSAVMRARTHYHIIRRHSRHPGVHAYYLEALLAIRDPRLPDLAAREISFLLRTHRVYHLQLQHLLYRLVLECGGLVSDSSRETILTALWKRVGFLRQSDLSSDDSVDATSMAHSASVMLFGYPDRPPMYNSTGALDFLLSIFSPTYALSLKWNALVLLSIFNSTRTFPLDEISWTGNHPIPQVALCWQVVFGLAVMEKMLQDSSSAPIQPIHAQAVLKSARTLCQLWLPIAESGQVSRDLACRVAICFLRATSLLADVTLFKDCQGFYRVEDCLGDTRTSLHRVFGAHYVAAAVRVQGPDRVLVALRTSIPDMEQQGQVLISAVPVLAPIDPSLAHSLYVVAQEQGAEPDVNATYALAMSFARRGALRQATCLLTQCQFSLEERGLVISAIAQSLREEPRAYTQDVLVSITHELASLYHSQVPPEHFRGHLEQLLVTLSRYGRGSQLVTVVLSIFNRAPGFFRPRFFVRYCHLLLRHKQFATASKLLGVIGATHPKITRSLSILADRSALHTRAFQMSGRTASLRGITSPGISPCLEKYPHAGPSLEHSLQDLLNSRRVLAAKCMFSSVRSTIPSRKRTALGNILLHGVSRQPAPRNGRRVRKVFALLEDLISNHGFQPDRVTANILIKVLIGWQSAFDSSRLRGLFDQLIRCGYPAADYSPLSPPFGTQQTQLSATSGLSKIASCVTFERHSKPLFKMFIKAFYLCNDVEAARKVVGILKVEQYKNNRAVEARQRARSQGRIKAVRRNVPIH